MNSNHISSYPHKIPVSAQVGIYCGWLQNPAPVGTHWDLYGFKWNMMSWDFASYQVLQDFFPPHPDTAWHRLNSRNPKDLLLLAPGDLTGFTKGKGPGSQADLALFFTAGIDVYPLDIEDHPISQKHGNLKPGTPFCCCQPKKKGVLSHYLGTRQDRFLIRPTTIGDWTRVDDGGWTMVRNSMEIIIQRKEINENVNHQPAFVTVSLSWEMKLVLGLSHDTVGGSWLTSACLFLTAWLFGSQGHEKKAPFSKTFLRPLGH